MNISSDIIKLSKELNIPGSPIEIKKFGQGHINDTFLLDSKHEGVVTSYLVQRVNTEIFTQPKLLMENIQKVTQAQAEQLKLRGVHDISRHCLQFLEGKNGSGMSIDDDGNYWRSYPLIKDSKTFQKPENLTQVYSAANAFGEFINDLKQLDPNNFYITFPDFHNLTYRFEQLELALKNNSANRLDSCLKEVDFAKKRLDYAIQVSGLAGSTKLPWRMTHNDTKLNNVLFDTQKDEAICVIDLDTVMPGLSFYDFGDMVRTMTSPTLEDETDLTKVALQMPLYKSLLEGFLHSLSDELTKTEKDMLYLAGPYMSLIMGVRFLTDYLNGDTYYKTERPKQNLERCSNQFCLVESMESQQEAMKDIQKKLGR